ncbi:unnamed protein product [Rhizoctonia solani]|uniref:Cytochrome P450 n=1 Tax=Rhizoctonia solani TaxID=456999 RepID=A0A8H3BI99_9AGAM|nr:unnamed protein product [Rhizoctonia solani]
MSHASSLFSSNQAHLLDRATALVQTHPLECSTTLMCILLGGYALRHIFMPSNYANIDGPRNNSIFSGHLKSLFSLDVVPFHDMLQDKYGSVAKVNGMLGKENLYVSDPRFMHEVLVKGVDTNFRHPQFTYDFLQMSFGPGILATTDSVHKAQRKIGVFETIAQRMTRSIARDVEGAAGRDIDMLYWCSATALELIGEAGLGHTFGILEGKETPYSIAIKNYFPAMARVSPLRALFPLFYNLRPVALQRKLAEWTPISYVRALKEIIDVQDDQARAILADKKAALKETPLEDGEMSHDIMSVLLKTNMELEQKDRLPEEEILAQINTLIFAGHETTSHASNSGTLARVLDIISQNQTIQHRLREEILQAPESLSYDEIQGLPYLDAVCRETLRLYPPFIVLEKEAIKDCTLPLKYPARGKNGEEIREVMVKKGTICYMGVREENRSKETWGLDADEFLPERWLEKLPNSVAESKTSGVYSGPRSCIGFKFSLLKLKMILSALVRSFKFEPSSTQVGWLQAMTITPYPGGTKEPFEEGKHPSVPLKVSTV